MLTSVFYGAAQLDCALGPTHLPFDGVEPLLDLVKPLEYVSQHVVDVAVGNVIGIGGKYRWLAANPGPFAATADDQPFITEHAKSVLDGADRHPEVLREFRLLGKRLARLECAVTNGRPQRVGNLLIRRPEIVGVDLVHGAERTQPAQIDKLDNEDLTTMSKLPIVPLVARFAASAQITTTAKAPASAGTPTGAHIEPLGETMQHDGTPMYRVKAVARTLDVSVATVYRLAQSGQLHSVRVGIGKGALRIPETSLNVYLAALGLPPVGQQSDGAA